MLIEEYKIFFSPFMSVSSPNLFCFDFSVHGSLLLLFPLVTKCSTNKLTAIAWVGKEFSDH